MRSTDYWNGGMVTIMGTLRQERQSKLKELYKFLLVGEADPQTKRPSAALSPEDLSDSEWYYLVCMSFVFNPNQR